MTCLEARTIELSMNIAILLYFHGVGNSSCCDFTDPSISSLDIPDLLR